MKAKHIITIVTALALSMTPAHAGDIQKQATEAAISAGAGSAAGALTFAVVGKVGVAVGGTALSIGLAPMAIAGITVGLAGYGVYSIFK